MLVSYKSQNDECYQRLFQTTETWMTPKASADQWNWFAVINSSKSLFNCCLDQKKKKTYYIFLPLSSHKYWSEVTWFTCVHEAVTKYKNHSSGFPCKAGWRNIRDITAVIMYTATKCRSEEYIDVIITISVAIITADTRIWNGFRKMEI